MVMTHRIASLIAQEHFKSSTRYKTILQAVQSSQTRHSIIGFLKRKRKITVQNPVKMQKKHRTLASQTRHSLFKFSNFQKQNRSATSLEECKRTWHRNHESQTRHSLVGFSNFQKQNHNAKRTWYRNQTFPRWILIFSEAKPQCKVPWRMRKTMTLSCTTIAKRGI